MSSYSSHGKKHGTKRKTGPNKWSIRVGCGYNKDGSIRRKSEVFYGTAREADERMEELYAEAIKAMQIYKGESNDEIE